MIESSKVFRISVERVGLPRRPQDPNQTFPNKPVPSHEPLWPQKCCHLREYRDHVVPAAFGSEAQTESVLNFVEGLPGTSTNGRLKLGRVLQRASKFALFSTANCSVNAIVLTEKSKPF